MPKSNGLWAVQDSGNESKLFNIDDKGGVIGEVNVGITNNDWEDLTCDAEGNLYIGDFGNNNNDMFLVYSKISYLQIIYTTTLTIL